MLLLLLLLHLFKRERQAWLVLLCLLCLLCHQQHELLGLRFSWENWYTYIQLNQDAAQAPHVDSGGEWDAQDDLGRSIKPRLNVGVNALI
jgi:hypothetical protein